MNFTSKEIIWGLEYFFCGQSILLFPLKEEYGSPMSKKAMFGIVQNREY